MIHNISYYYNCPSFFNKSNILFINHIRYNQNTITLWNVLINYKHLVILYVSYNPPCYKGVTRSKYGEKMTTMNFKGAK